MSTTEELGQNLQKAGCGLMASGCGPTILSPLIIIAAVVLVASALSLWPLLLLAIPAFILPWIRYRRLLAGRPQGSGVTKLEIWVEAGKQSWKPALKFYGIVAGALMLIGIAGWLLTPLDDSGSGEPTALTAQEGEIGTWQVRYQGVNITTTIYRKGENGYMRQRFDDGSTLSGLLGRLPIADALHYFILLGDNPNASMGELMRENNLTQFIVHDNGRLELRDVDGTIWTARPKR